MCYPINQPPVPNPSIITPTVSRTPDPIELSGAPLDSKRSSITENFLPMLFGVALVFLVMFGWSFYDAGHPGTGHDQAGRQETLISTTSHQASIASASRFASIEQIRLGWRVETGISNAERREAIGIESDAPWWDRRDTVIEQSDWRHVSMSVTNRDGSQVEVHLLRPMSWLQEESVTVGGTIHLQLTELGVDGPALIQSINECPTIQPGLGRVVIGRFIHRRDGVMWMKLSDVGKPIGITDTHHVYSVDRGEFLPAGQLQVGETLKLHDRLTQITSLTPNAGTHQVFNLEVQGEHVFRVTTSGLLVHNTCGNVSKGKGDFDGAQGGTKIKDLNPLDTPAHTAQRPWLQKLSDAELLSAARTPKDGNGLVRNTRTGNLHDGNGRALELRRRAADPHSKISPDDLVPVGEYTPDMSMFLFLD